MSANKNPHHLLQDFRRKLAAILLKRDKKIKAIMDRARLEAARRDLK